MTRQTSLFLSATLLICLVLISTTNAFIHHLNIKDDIRQVFLIESFGLGKNGVMKCSVANWKLNGQPIDSSMSNGTGFFIKVTDTDASALVDEIILQKDCVHFFENQSFFFTYKSGDTTNFDLTVDAPGFKEGFYNLHFINCNHGDKVSFDLSLEQYNVESNGQKSYLSIGDTPLPTLYGVFSAVFFGLLLLWVFFFLKGEGKRVNKIHHLCTAYLLIQSISLLFEAIEKHYIKTTGSAHGWNVAYYIFACLQGSFFIVLIALIGSGWAFIKPYLSDKDKTIFMVVIPLQILDNIALVMVDEEAPGSVGSIGWKHIFTVVDIICCIAILIPIIWSIKHLKDASQVDDKAAQNLQKLTLFRQFYLFVISYIYFTRIIITLLRSTLPFKWVWLGDCFQLIAALIFYSTTGYQFRPSLDNPYFHLPQNEDGVQMSERGVNTDRDDD
ncbi:hypothetical protein SAMD00019534_116630 [Acytostelium subglobosum LB1]|uniref:hypothetical protein n=1 Tax=Acytostelium subglobosum LB1 TaxID=1410327 RepID=UPI0006448296|nr:hypothetical protein SAMD00019534_116630 [Acytostelium subglobosum LB1]GAM28487.1 hypothetical protein SAMD00019534_116630 [Acytostelium subglobosum LB1]|eukprot:XP_012748526.1 hypothetical protein SAMD00019534_116630 [Acytostelium subglobosum LB1]